MREPWVLDPTVEFLNHGSFGACPRSVLEHQSALRQELESNPVRFMTRRVPGGLDEARQAVAPMLGADPRDIAFVRNATEGVNTVLRALRLEPGDELLTTNHVYPACRQAMRYVCERQGASLKVVDVPFPLSSDEPFVETLVGAVGPRTRLALVDHVTSVTGLVLPVKRIVAELRAAGVSTLIDGAHAPGMVHVDLEDIGADYYAASFHKWLCAPKGAAMLWVRPELQAGIVPLIVSHAFALDRDERFLATFDWTGTSDPTPWMCVPKCIDVVGSLLAGGWPAVRAHNHRLALRARDTLCNALDIASPAPDEMLGSLASVPLPAPLRGSSNAKVLYEALLERRYETLVINWPDAPERVLRVSCQLYNDAAQYEALARDLVDVLARLDVPDQP